MESSQSLKISLAPSVRHIRPSATLAINELSNTLRQQGKQIYKFGFGQSPFPVPEEVVQALRDHAHQKDYLPVKGLLQLREAIAGYYARQGLQFHPQNILVGPGSKELMLILQLCFDGEIWLPSPSWVSYEPQAQLAQKPVRWLPTFEQDAWRLRAETLAEACRKKPKAPKLLVLNYPNNPVGTTYSSRQLKAIASIARENNILILSDEIYGDLHHIGQHLSIAHFYPEGTIISSGLSKWCGAGGWRLGTFALPDSLDWLVNALAVVASETFTSTSAPIQYAAVRAFEGSPAIDDYLLKSRHILQLVASYCHKKLYAAGVEVSMSDGGFYLFPNFNAFKQKKFASKQMSGIDFCQQLLEETGVALLPGSAFGRPAMEWTARLSYVHFDGAQALENIGGLLKRNLTPEEWVATNCPEMKKGMECLVNWLGDRKRA